jgi:hypothetical protein
MAAVLITGWLAGWLVSPVMWIMTAGVGATLLVADGRARRRALRAPSPADLSGLPSRLRRTFGDAFEAIGAGRARQALEDIASRAAPLLQELENRPDDRAIHGDVVALADAACTLAVELNRVDGFLAMPEAAHTPDSRARCRAASSRLAARLSDASTAIEALHAQLLEEGSSASDRVAELASELTKEATARQAAAQELAQLLSGVTTAG